MPASLPLHKPPASICLLRFSALGDITHMLPIVATLKKHWPQTKLTWIVGKFEHKLVGDLPGVEFVIFNKSAGFAGLRQLRRDLGSRRFEVLLHMQTAFRANLAALCVKADLRLGYDRGRAKDLHLLTINRRIPQVTGEHVLDCFFSYLNTLGLTEREYDWQLPIPDDAWAFAKAHVGPQPTLVISPCSSHALRNWSAQGYAAVADHAVRAHGMKVLICGGPSELEVDMGAAIQEHMTQTAVNLVGKDTLKQLLAVLARADLVISPDSGPAHMATAVNTPVIGLHAPSNPWRSGPYRSRSLCVDQYGQAAMHHRGKATDQLPWGTKLEYPGVMDLIKVEQVIERLDEIRAGTRS